MARARATMEGGYKVNTLRLDKGDGYAVETGGGGGFGDPLERPAEQVLQDVTSEYVSVEVARRDYGVVFNAVGRHFALDIAADVPAVTTQPSSLQRASTPSGSAPVLSTASHE